MPYIKHVFKYQEYRRTQFLNTMAKDDLGRHRGGVLYGMKLIPMGNQIYVDSGALYTPSGTKIFWDATATSLGPTIGVVNIAGLTYGPVGPLVLTDVADRPIVIAVVAQFPPSTLQSASNAQPQIESAADLAGTTPPVTFSAFVAAYRQDTARPGFNLFAHHPVEMAESGVPGWSASDAGSSDQALRTVDGSWTPASAVRAVPGITPSSLAAVQISQVIIGYIILGGTNLYTPSTLGSAGVWADGVVYVPVANPWQSLQSILGVDPLMGRTDGLVDGGVAEPLDVNTGALSQAAVSRQMATTSPAAGCPLGVPRFGTTDVDINGFKTDWGTYRFPNFLRDGDSILDSLRRMDYLMRLWMDKTGDQGLVRSAQDGVIYVSSVYLPRFAHLKDLLYQMSGSNAPSALNLNTANWGADDDLPLNIGGDAFAANIGSIGADTVMDHVLVSGVITHKPQQLDITTMGLAGDSHRQAIRALDWALYHVLNDVLGITVRRSWLRLQAPWSAGQPLPSLLDLPQGYPVNNVGQTGVQSGFTKRPAITVIGSLGSPAMVASDFNIYLGTESVRAAVEAAAKRTSENTGPNLLHNPVFAKTGPTANGVNPPLDWLTNSSIWAITPNPGTGRPRRLVMTLAATTGYLRQYVDLTSNPELLGALLDGEVLSVSVSLANMSTAPGLVYVGLKLLDGAVPGLGVNDLVTVGHFVSPTGTTEADGYTTVTFALTLPPMRDSAGAPTNARTTLLAQVKGIGIEILNTDGFTKSISIAGAYLGAGMPPLGQMGNQSYYEFLSREGGVEARMRGALVMGQKQINEVALATHVDDAPRVEQTVSRFALVDDFDAHGKRITNGADATDVQDFVTLAQLLSSPTTPTYSFTTPGAVSQLLPAGRYVVVVIGGAGAGGGYGTETGNSGHAAYRGNSGLAAAAIYRVITLLTPQTLTGVVAAGGLGGGCGGNTSFLGLGGGAAGLGGASAAGAGSNGGTGTPYNENDWNGAGGGGGGGGGATSAIIPGFLTLLKANGGKGGGGGFVGGAAGGNGNTSGDATTLAATITKLLDQFGAISTAALTSVPGASGTVNVSNWNGQSALTLAGQTGQSGSILVYKY